MTKVYCFSTDDTDAHYAELTDEQFIAEAEKHGNTYSLEDFTKAFNFCNVNTYTDVIRIITIDKI